MPARRGASPAPARHRRGAGAGAGAGAGSSDDEGGSSVPRASGKRRRVAIIGGGPSGLAAIKACLEEGHEPTCFEADDDIGGLWRFKPEEGHSSCYASTIINSSKEFNAFSDYPIPDSWPTFLHHSQLLQYFRDYADAFGLREHVRLNARVVDVRRPKAGPGFASKRRQRRGGNRGSGDGDSADGDGDGDVDLGAGWEVTVREPGGTVTSHFDAVAVCSGHHWDPNWPTFDGMSTFKGKQMHSHAYKDARGFEGKRVVIVGIGNSGVDIAVELSRVAASVNVATRSGAWIFQRHALGRPIDHTANTRLMQSLPVPLLSRVGEFIGKALYGGLDQYGLTPKHGILAAHPTINSELIPRIVTGTVRVRPNVARLTRSGVVFEDGTEEEADVVIFATGYNVSFPFLHQSAGVRVQDNHVSLYKFMWPVDTAADAGGPPLAVIGLIQPLGSIMPISDMQSRWFARVVSGAARLPSRAAMQADIEAKAKAMAARYRRSKRHTIQVDYVPHMDELASQIGAKPSVARLGCSDPRLAWAVLAKPAIPAQYRLFGPHPWEGARDAILRITDAATVEGPMRTRVVSASERREGPSGVHGWSAHATRLCLASFALVMVLAVVLGLLELASATVDAVARVRAGGGLAGV